MSGLMLAVFAFLIGITVSGLLGSILEIATGRRLGFVEPFVSPRRVAVSLLVTLAAGPMMLGNDALQARREGRVGHATLVVAAVVVVLWTCAMGIVTAEVASMLSRPIG